MAAKKQQNWLQKLRGEPLRRTRAQPRSIETREREFDLRLRGAALRTLRTVSPEEYTNWMVEKAKRDLGVVELSRRRGEIQGGILDQFLNSELAGGLGQGLAAIFAGGRTLPATGPTVTVRDAPKAAGQLPAGQPEDVGVVSRAWIDGMAPLGPEEAGTYLLANFRPEVIANLVSAPDAGLLGWLDRVAHDSPGWAGWSAWAKARDGGAWWLATVQQLRSRVEQQRLSQVAQALQPAPDAAPSSSIVAGIDGKAPADAAAWLWGRRIEEPALLEGLPRLAATPDALLPAALAAMRRQPEWAELAAYLEGRQPWARQVVAELRQIMEPAA